MTNEDTNLPVTMIVLLLVVLVSSILLFKDPLEISTNKVALKKGYVRDLAVTMNMMCSYSYDSVLEKTVDLEDYVIYIDDRSFQMYSSQDIKVLNTKDVEIVNRDGSFEAYTHNCKNIKKTVLQNPSKITFTRNNNEMLVT